MRHHDGVDQSDHALVTMARAQFGQAQSIGLNDAHIGLLGFGQESAHASISARALNVDLHNGVGGGSQSNTNGVKAVKYFGLG